MVGLVCTVLAASSIAIADTCYDATSERCYGAAPLMNLKPGPKPFLNAKISNRQEILGMLQKSCTAMLREAHKR